MHRHRPHHRLHATPGLPLTSRLLCAPFWRWAALGLACASSACSGEPDTYYDCSLEGRKAFVGRIMTDYYLWYDRVPKVDYAAAESPEALMAQMTFKELDHWSGMQRQAERTAFFDQGRFQGLGYTLGLDAEGGLRISWVHEGSAAGRAGLDRGALILGVNGRAVADMTGQELGVELAQDVVTHQIQELDGTIHDVELTQGDVEITSVKGTTILDTPNGPVGYLMFTTFVQPGDQELRDAFARFQAEGVQQLVIDLRYNGGGLLSIAALLGSLIDSDAAGQPLILETYNQLHGNLNRRRLMYDTEQGVSVSKVVFLTTGRTASASEQVINGLRPYLDVGVVGLKTLGKPVGADSWDHCEYSIAPITFHSVNADGEGDFFTGIQPACDVEDDLLHRLGDPEEAQLGAALRLLNGQAQCEAAETLSSAHRPVGAPAVTLPPGRFPDLPGWY
jgi:carboxyl-terminal processing protease